MRNFTKSFIPHRRSLGVGLLTALLGISSFSCALYDPTGDKKSVTKICRIPDDQTSTISARWSVIPIPLAFHQGDFSAAETTPMAQAAETWNVFFNASQGHGAVLDYGGDINNPRTSPAVTNLTTNAFCAQGILQGNKFNGSTNIYKTSKWTYSSSVIGVTRFCTQQGSGTSTVATTSTPPTAYPKMYMAAMEFNYQNFFVEGQKQPDMQTIMLHELGHLLGLNHGCEVGSTKVGMPDCASASLSSDYKLASMFPQFSFDLSGIGEQKQALGVNDEERAICLYPTPTTN